MPVENNFLNAFQFVFDVLYWANRELVLTIFRADRELRRSIYKVALHWVIKKKNRRI